MRREGQAIPLPARSKEKLSLEPPRVSSGDWMTEGHSGDDGGAERTVVPPWRGLSGATHSMSPAPTTLPT